MLLSSDLIKLYNYFFLKGMMMKTKAIVIIVLMLCALLSSPLFAGGDPVPDECIFDTTGVWSFANNWDSKNIPDHSGDWVVLSNSAVCDFDVSPYTIAELYGDISGSAGTLDIGAGETLTVSDFVRMGRFVAGGEINIAGTVVVEGNNSEYAVEFDAPGQGTTTQINVTSGGLLKLYAPSDTKTYESRTYRYVIRYATDTGYDVFSGITVSGTGVMEFYNTIDTLVPAIEHTDNDAGPITVSGNGYIKYVGFDAMDTIADDADDNGGVFAGTSPPSPQKYTPADVTTEDMAYDQDTGDGIAWFYDGADTYLFPCKSPDGMTTIDAGTGGARTLAEGATGITLDATLDKASDDTANYTFAWECTPSDGVTYSNQNSEDPNVYFPSTGTYTLKVTATSDDATPYIISDWVTYYISVTRASIMVTHLAIDEGELKAAEDGDWTPAEYFKDSSWEGNPENHHLITFTGSDGWSDRQGVVGCGDNDSLYSDDDGAIAFYLDHNVSGFNEAAAHLDNIDTAITVALWYKAEDDKHQVVIYKEDTWSIETDRSDYWKTGIWVEGDGDFTYTDSDTGSSSLGRDLYDNKLIVRGSDVGDENAWHHIAFSYDSVEGRVKQYVDGVLVTNDNDKHSPGELIATYPEDIKMLVIGGKMDGSDDLRQGGLDDIRIYNYVLEDYEVAELAAMGESVAMVYAGSSFTVEPNQLPVQLDGAYVKLGRGSDKINKGDSDNDNRIMWKKQNGPGDVIFANTADPTTEVTFTQPGVYELRLMTYDQFCGGSNDHYDSVIVTVNPATNCAGYLALGGDPEDFDDDCDVDVDDLMRLAYEWLDVSSP